MKELTNCVLSIMESTMQPRQIRKHFYFLKAGQVCRELILIRKGLVRCYYKLGDQEISTCFMKEGDWLVAIESFYEKAPAYEYFQALENTEVYSITYPQLQSLLQQYPEANDFARVLTQHYYREWRGQLLALRGQPATARYQWLLKNHSDLILRVPAKYLASWPGMAEITFCKIRATSHCRSHRNH